MSGAESHPKENFLHTPSSRKRRVEKIFIQLSFTLKYYFSLNIKCGNIVPLFESIHWHSLSFVVRCSLDCGAELQSCARQGLEWMALTALNYFSMHNECPFCLPTPPLLSSHYSASYRFLQSKWWNKQYKHRHCGKSIVQGFLLLNAQSWIFSTFNVKSSSRALIIWHFVFLLQSTSFLYVLYP